MYRLAVLLLAGVPALPMAAAQDKPTIIGKIVRLDPAFDKLVPPEAQLEKIAGGYIWTEGTVWVKNGGYLLFSDIPNNVVIKWKEGEGASKFVYPAGYTGKKPRGGKPGDEPGSNGLSIDPQGRLTLCEHGDRRVARIDVKLGPDTKPFIGAMKKTTLAYQINGKRLNSPNDMVWHSNGDLYFTDPPYGMEKIWDDPARELDYCGVYLLKPDGTLKLLTKELSRPNGIALSPDEKTLYVANSDPFRPVWMAFPVNSDGTIGEGKVFYDASHLIKAKKVGLPDGMKVDIHGNLWATGPGGVLVLTPDAKLLGYLDTGVPTANCCFGGPDGSTLYVACNHDIGRIRTTTKGKGF
ncbi:MAG: SMP-30/gluconolactonase/LRE family protein [Gemmataceae bacterium]|nr:SMP-30/gluconolactonase/LRE family protein [Gemmataceae bacterium]